MKVEGGRRWSSCVGYSWVVGIGPVVLDTVAGMVVRDGKLCVCVCVCLCVCVCVRDPIGLVCMYMRKCTHVPHTPHAP